jgi:uncharacterized cupin superfamily protein
VSEYHWRKHDEQDELVLVLDGELLLDVEGRELVVLGPRRRATSRD